MIKRPREVALMAEAGRLLAHVFERLDRTELIGMTTLQVDQLVERYIVDDLNARLASKGQYGYGFVLNCSINEVVCHGVPSGTRVLREGDIVNLDITLEKNGYIADSSKTYLLGKVSPAAEQLVQVTYEALWQGIRVVRPGARLGDIGPAIEPGRLNPNQSPFAKANAITKGIVYLKHFAPSLLHDLRAGITVAFGVEFIAQ